MKYKITTRITKGIKALGHAEKVGWFDTPPKVGDVTTCVLTGQIETVIAVEKIEDDETN